MTIQTFLIWEYPAISHKTLWPGLITKPARGCNRGTRIPPFYFQSALITHMLKGIQLGHPQSLISRTLKNLLNKPKSILKELCLWVYLPVRRPKLHRFFG